MQVTETLSDGLKRAFTVVLPPPTSRSRRTERLADLGKTLSLPGFRPGKVPPVVVRQRYGTAVTAEVLEESVKRRPSRCSTSAACARRCSPSVDLLNQDAVAAAGVSTDLEFKVELEVLPDITLPDFGAIELTRLKAEAAPDVAGQGTGGHRRPQPRRSRRSPPRSLANAAPRRARWSSWTTPGASTATEFPGGKAADARVEVGGEGFIPGFTEQIEGIRPGETRNDPGNVPRRLRGTDSWPARQAEFEITAKRIERARCAGGRR